MPLSDITCRVDRLPGFDDLLAALAEAGGHAQVEGLTGPVKSLVVARTAQRFASRVLLITHQNEQAQRLWDDLRNFGIPESRLHLLPASERHWLSNDVTDYRAQGERIAALVALATEPDCVVIGTPEAFYQRSCPPEYVVDRKLALRSGGTYPLDDLLATLVDLGYDGDTTVSRPGQFSHRGGILDIFPITSPAPVRLEFFGDDIESMRQFDVGSQRSTGPIDSVTLYPVREITLDPALVEAAVPAIRSRLETRCRELAAKREREARVRLSDRVEDDLRKLSQGTCFEGVEEYLQFLVEQPLCALDYALTPGSSKLPLVVVDDPGQVTAHWDRIRDEIAVARERRFDRGDLLEGADQPNTCVDGPSRALAEFPVLALCQLTRVYEGFDPTVRLAVSSAQTENFRSRLDDFSGEVRTWLANGASCYIVSDQPQRVREICRELDLPVETGDTPDLAEGAAAGAVRILEGRLRLGLKFADIGLYVATDAELFGTARSAGLRRRASTGRPISTLLDLREGDYVVHVQHGIGLYRGLVRRRVDDADRDFLYIQYAGADRLYVPADQIDRVQRYVGGDGAPPQVNRIGGNEWQRTTKRVKEQARLMAKELVALYAARQVAERSPFGGDTPWQVEMEDAFPYETTPSQARAIRDAKHDLEQGKPMDRLVCGDVGFGKTEVAVRTAFKVVEAGKQVAVLCPTTILAAQHHATFSQRLAAYPVKVELLSRFRSRQEQQASLTRLESGASDIAVGTHRILSKDVKFHNLGLLIVDEEQRFGVAQKERLKQLRKTVDVMTLSATPIPRTLSMALSGLRDMSLIDDPPSGRVPIITYVREYDEDLVRDAIIRELERDGQVYFVHNRVETIDHVAERIQRLVPDARLRVGHGQMSEDELEKIMHEFYHREFDVLVCTTIIENGLDIANVNTMIVDRAERMGLSQLYQLRGRVGRSNRQAYAYLLYQPNKVLSTTAEERLIAIRDFTSLGSGYQIAMRDLEIRGAGNLLGAEQSGAMVSVGFDMYCQLLAEAVAEAKGEDLADETLPPVDLPITAHIPDEYIPNEAERIYFYKRMSGVRSKEDIDNLREELEDRYGDPPKAVWNAFIVLGLRLHARNAGIAAIRGEQRSVSLRFAPHVHLTPEAVRLLTYAFKGHRFTADSVILNLTTPRVVDEVEDMLTVIERALQEGHRPRRGIVHSRRRSAET